MASNFQERQKTIERRLVERRQGKNLSAAERIQLERSGGNHRIVAERRRK